MVLQWYFGRGTIINVISLAKSAIVQLCYFRYGTMVNHIT